MKTRNERIEEFLNSLNTDVDIMNCIGEVENIDFENAFSSIYSLVDDNNGFDIEIIYYSRAMEYLSENDASLMESLAIASDMGYDPVNLNSEILASLLASQNVREEFNDLEVEIDSFFLDIVEEIERIEENEENI